MNDGLADRAKMSCRQSAVSPGRSDISSAVPFDQFASDGVLVFDEYGVLGH
jgi:hypothetical protein